MTRHDVDNPDPLCWGDDPCVCEQLIEARKQAIRDCITVVERFDDSNEYPQIHAALRHLRNKT
jgi:hypothetical protein